MFLNAIFPPKCIFCGKYVKSNDFKVCRECAKKLEFNNKKCRICARPTDDVYGSGLCPECTRHKRPFCGAAVPFKYKGLVRNALLRFKFGMKVSYAKTFAAFIFTELSAQNINPDIITYVPVHFLRRGSRGYDQCELLAHELSKITGAELKKLVKKTKHTKPLSTLSGAERKKSVKNVYKYIGKEDFSDKIILLLDDIITTGSTISEVSRILKPYCSKIYICAAAAVE